jgi:hypothetical protein
MIFTPEEISTDQLKLIKDESRPGLYKDMVELISEWFWENEKTEMHFTAKQFKDKYYPTDSRISINYISKICKEEFEKQYVMRREIPISDQSSESPYQVTKVGNYFTFYPEDVGLNNDFISDKNQETDCPF